MTDRAQLAAALRRLDPRHREALDYSLHRRVPDDELGELLCASTEDAVRLRAAAVERLSRDLGVEGGAELGSMLQELLDPATWALVEPSGPAGAPEADAGERRRAPVLDMLAPGGGSHRGVRRVAIGLGVAIAVLAPVGVVVALSRTGDPALSEGRSGTAGSGARPFAPQTEDAAAEPRAAAEPSPPEPERAVEFPVARVDGKTALYDKPDGKIKLRIPGRTQWRSPRVLSIVEQRGDWLAVLAPELRNGEVGWIPKARAERLDTVPWSVRADLSKRMVVVRRGRDVVRRFRVGVGRAGHSTPTGRFAVTDKLRVSDGASPYGCCVVALTGHQTRLPEGWPGGDRLAIHATSDESGLGRAVSLGCMRAQPEMARWLMERVPIGTPVFIRG